MNPFCYFLLGIIACDFLVISFCCWQDYVDAKQGAPANAA